MTFFSMTYVFLYKDDCILLVGSITALGLLQCCLVNSSDKQILFLASSSEQGYQASRLSSLAQSHTSKFHIIHD